MNIFRSKLKEALKPKPKAISSKHRTVELDMDHPARVHTNGLYNELLDSMNDYLQEIPPATPTGYGTVIVNAVSMLASSGMSYLLHTAKYGEEAASEPDIEQIDRMKMKIADAIRTIVDDEIREMGLEVEDDS